MDIASNADYCVYNDGNNGRWANYLNPTVILSGEAARLSIFSNHWTNSRTYSKRRRWVFTEEEY